MNYYIARVIINAIAVVLKIVDDVQLEVKP